jgi:hypothetical protein
MDVKTKGSIKDLFRSNHSSGDVQRTYVLTSSGMRTEFDWKLDIDPLPLVISRHFFRVIDDENVDRPLLRFQPQSQLLLDSRVDRRAAHIDWLAVDDGRIAGLEDALS